jgi:hypothetical protein
MGSSEWNLFDDNCVVGGTEKVKPPLWPRRRSLLHNDAEEEERAIERTA